MKKEDTKQTSVFGRLSNGSKQRNYDRMDFVTIDV